MNDCRYCGGSDATWNPVAGEYQCGACRQWWTEDLLDGPRYARMMPGSGAGPEVLDWSRSARELLPQLVSRGFLRAYRFTFTQLLP